MSIKTNVDAMFIGRPKAFREDGEMSAIKRDSVVEAVMLTKLGFEGDQVADPIHHGGVDKAMHYYPIEHYEYWRDMMPAHPLLERAGAFGENISARGLLEADVRIGDQFELGKARVEISHGRQPCWKLDHHFDRKDVMKTIIKTGLCGLYLRVIEEGMVKVGDRLEQTYRADDAPSVAHVFDILIAGRGPKEKIERQAMLDDLSSLTTLAATWRMRATKLAESL